MSEIKIKLDNKTILKMSSPKEQDEFAVLSKKQRENKHKIVYHVIDTTYGLFEYFCVLSQKYSKVPSKLLKNIFYSDNFDYPIHMTLIGGKFQNTEIDLIDLLSQDYTFIRDVLTENDFTFEVHRIDSEQQRIEKVELSEYSDRRKIEDEYPTVDYLLEQEQSRYSDLHSFEQF